MTDVGTALEKLIDVLQLEGHELFEIFVKAQGVIGLANILITLVSIFGGIFGGFYFWKMAKQHDWGFDDGEKVGIGFFGGIIIGLLLLITSYSLFSGYMHIYYSEYTAAREVISHIRYLT